MPPTLRQPKPRPFTPTLASLDPLLAATGLPEQSTAHSLSSDPAHLLALPLPIENPRHRLPRARMQRRFAERCTRQQLLQRAAHLEPTDRAILTAFLDLGLSVQHIAALRNQPPKHIRNRLDSLRAALSDPAFLLAVRYAPYLPHPYAAIARNFFIRGLPLRQLATLHQKSLHAIRESLLIARTLMLLTLAKKQLLPPTPFPDSQH